MRHSNIFYCKLFQIEGASIPQHMPPSVHIEKYLCQQKAAEITFVKKCCKKTDFNQNSVVIIYMNYIFNLDNIPLNYSGTQPQQCQRQEISVPVFFLLFQCYSFL